MPRHHPGIPPSAEPGRAGRRLSAAVGSGVGRGAGSGAGLLAGPPRVTPPESEWAPGPDDSPAQSRIRWRTGQRAAALLCLLAAVFLGWFWWQAANGTSEVSPLGSVTAAESGDVAAPTPETEPGPGTDESPGQSAGDSGGNIIVHVAGAVVRAGIVELPQGSRLHEAIAAAGGSAPDADPDQLNLAAVLEDGQKVLVPRRGETVPAGPASAADAGAAPGSPAGGGGGTAPAAGKINLNTAGVDELATLPRVGPVLAQRIVEWRAQHGRFQRVEELDAVDGVGPKLLAALLPLVRV
jgi:competence protein ComEA